MADARGQWGSRLGFVLAAAGSAIGLGNLWKFPFITWDNGGGAFVLVYLGAIIAVGLPIMIAEIMIGRKTQKSVVGAMADAIGPRWRIVGGLGVLTGFIILSYYTVVAGWTLRYFWRCLNWSISGFPQTLEAGPDFGAFVGDATLQVILSALFMALTVIVVAMGIGRGIERVTRTLMPALFVILLLMLASAMTMPGAGEALGFIFKPNFSELSGSAVLEAVGHAFFTLSLGMGAMITYGSYLRRRESVVSASAMVVGLDTIIAMVATGVMFAVIFSSPGLSEQITKSAGMLFITLPALFYEVVPLGRLLAPLFYLLVGFAALTSTISLLEVVASYFIDQHGLRRRTAALGCGIGIFVVTVLCALSNGAVAGLSEWPAIFHGANGIKQGVFNTLDHLASNWLLPLGGLGLTIAAGWALSTKVSREELIEATTPRWFSYPVWLVFIRFVAPAAVLTILVFVIVFGRDFS